MPSPKQLPSALVESIKNGRVVLFLGAGASMEAKSDAGERAPSGGAMAKLLQEEFLGAQTPTTDLMITADIAAQKAGGHVVSEYIRNKLREYKPSDAHKLLPAFRWHTIATTNYDTLVEDAYGATENPLQDLLKFVKDREPIEIRRASVQRPLDYLKLHGCIEHAHDAEIPLVLDPAHYERYKLNREKLYNRLEQIAHELPFLFVGYGLSDPHVRNIIHRLERTGDRPEYYVVSPSPPEMEVQYWAGKRIVSIDATFGEFMKLLDAAVPALFRAIAPASLKNGIPLQKFFRTNADPSERAVTSLNYDLLHVHSSMPVATQPAKEFFRGYDNGFSAISRNLDSYRRITNDILVDLIDDLESDAPRFYLLRGPAGVGKTVTLKRTAWDLSNTFDSPTLWLKDGGVLKPEVLVELCNLIGKRIYVFVDRAAERIRMLQDALSTSFARRLPITFVGAERDATWNVTQDEFDQRWDTKPYHLGQLHQREISDLLKKLEEHSALGVLAGVTPQERVAAFEQADRHLLVALHEVTEGKPFEEIVLDECASLSPDKAKQLYLDICTLGQFDAPARAGVINRISGIPFSLYQEQFFLPLENVVLTERNPYTGDYEYRARHKRVASLVFRQYYETDEQRRDQILRIISSLDEGYKSDSIAISNLTKAHNLRKLISNVDVGRDLYTEYISLLGDQWFLWQQAAIYELHHPDGSLERAEEVCAKALALANDREAVLHTHAEVARYRAQQASTPTEREVYRRQSFERLARIKSGQSRYTDSSRCKLRLDQMLEAASELDQNNDDDSQAFAEKCRVAFESIERARSRHPADGEFYELEARFYQIIDDDAHARRALERAWELKPDRPNVALQLANMHRRAGNSESEKRILLSALERHSTDPSINLAAAQFYLRNQEDPQRAAFHFARAYSKSDRNYVARFDHAIYLFGTGEGQQAAALFEEVNQLAPSDFRQHYSPKKDAPGGEPKRYSGRVAKIEDTYAFIATPTYPNEIYANINDSDEAEWARLSRNAAITFEVGFTRKGPVAVSVFAARN